MKKFLRKSCAIKIMQKHVNNKLNCGAHLPQPPGVMSPIKKAVSWSSRIFIFRNNTVGGITRRAAFPRLPLHVINLNKKTQTCNFPNAKENLFPRTLLEDSCWQNQDHLWHSRYETLMLWHCYASMIENETLCFCLLFFRSRKSKGLKLNKYI